MADQTTPNSTPTPAGDGASAPRIPDAYNESKIRVLDDVEHVRTRPGMYVGGNNLRGLHHLVYEIVDNSIDEALAGYCKSILVKINADGSCMNPTSFPRPSEPTRVAENLIGPAGRKA